MIKKNSGETFRESIFLGLYVFLPIILHFFFLSISKYNYPMADDSRIIGEFFIKYFNADSATGKIKAVFEKENEGSPALIRFIYLLSYFFTGKIEFKIIGVLGNFLAFIPMYIVYDLFKTSKKNLFLILPIPYILLSTISFFTFYYSYVTLFYIGSVVLPVMIFYQYFVKKSNFWVYLLLTVLLFSSAVTVITAALILIHAIFTKSYKNALVFAFFICIYFLIVKVLLKSTTPTVNTAGLDISQLFSSFTIVLKLFLITLGSWIFIFFKGKFLLSLIFGVCQIIVVLLLSIGFYKKNDSTTLFFSVSLLFISVLIFINIWFRWNGNEERYLNYIISFEKSYFIFLFLALLVSFVFFFKPYKNLALGVFFAVFFVYLYQYYYSYSSWLNWYRTSLLSTVNKEWMGKNASPFRNNTNIYMYQKLIDKGYCKVESNVFTENKAIIEAYIEKQPKKQSFDLQLVPTDSSSFRREMVFFSFKNSFAGNALNQLDGIYLLFVNKADKYLVPAQFNAQNPLKAILKRSMYATWMSAQISNVLDDELKEKEYEIYVLNVEQGIFRSIIATNKKIIKNNSQFNLIEVDI